MNAIELALDETLARPLTPSSRPPSVGGWLQRLVRPAQREGGQSLALARTALHRVRKPLGCTVTCDAGTLWLTFDYTQSDLVLEAGESHRCLLDSPLLIQALQASRLHID